MHVAPVITIYVRHSADCKYAGDEFSKRCDCRKHFRWTQNGKRTRRKAETRSWAEAEQLKRQLEDQLAGKKTDTEQEVRDIGEAVGIFIEDKRVQGVSNDVLNKYTRELARLRVHCEAEGVFVVQNISRDVITGFCATWPRLYPSSTTRAKARERLRSFFRYCYEAEWLPRIPIVPRFKIDEPEAEPLTADEYARLLDAVYGVVDSKRDGALQKKIHAFIQCMRWSGLAIRDAFTLPTDRLLTSGEYRIETSRRKTGTPVSVLIPRDVAEEMLAVAGEDYFFWTGNGDPQSGTKNWGKRYIAPCFKAAKIPQTGYLLSHRLRDTFAVHNLESGMPMEELSRLLGHTSIKTTEKHYAKWSKKRQDRADSFVIGSWEKPKKESRKAATSKGEPAAISRQGAKVTTPKAWRG